MEEPDMETLKDWIIKNFFYNCDPYKFENEAGKKLKIKYEDYEKYVVVKTIKLEYELLIIVKEK